MVRPGSDGQQHHPNCDNPWIHFWCSFMFDTLQEPKRFPRHSKKHILLDTVKWFSIGHHSQVNLCVSCVSSDQSRGKPSLRRGTIEADLNLTRRNTLMST